MVHRVIKMKMLESVDVEIHLVVLAHPVVVYSQKRKLGQDVIDGGDSDLRLFAARISAVTMSAQACPSLSIASCTAILCGVTFSPFFLSSSRKYSIVGALLFLSIKV